MYNLLASTSPNSYIAWREQEEKIDTQSAFLNPT